MTNKLWNKARKESGLARFERSNRRKPMTIALGMFTNSGVILAADRYLDDHTEKKKIRSYDLGGQIITTVAVGDFDRTLAFWDYMEHEFSGKPFSIPALSRATIGYHRKFTKDEWVASGLFVILGQYALYELRNDTIHTVHDPYTVMGAGQKAASAVCELLWDMMLSDEQKELLAIASVLAAKRSVSECGGLTDLVHITQHIGEQSTFVVAELEKRVEHLMASCVMHIGQDMFNLNQQWRNEIDELESEVRGN